MNLYNEYLRKKFNLPDNWCVYRVSHIGVPNGCIEFNGALSDDGGLTWPRNKEMFCRFLEREADIKGEKK